MTISSLAVKIASAVLVLAFLSSRVAEAEFTYAYDWVSVDHYAGYGASSSGNGIIAVNYPGHPSSYIFSDTLTENGGTSEVTHGYANVAVVLTPTVAGFSFGDGTGVSQSRNATGPPAQLVIRTNEGGPGTPPFTWQGGRFYGLVWMHFTLSGNVGPRAGDYCRFDAWAEFHAHDGADVPLELHWVNNQPGSQFSGIDLYVEAPMTFNSDALDIIVQVNFTVVDPNGNGSLSAVGSTASNSPTNRSDFNRDGKPDYLLYNPGTRQTVVWFLNNNVRIGGAFAPTLPVGWSVIDVADFNRDGRPDYALFNASTRRTAIWYLSGVNGVTLIGSAWGPIPPAGWILSATGDFNNDAKPDFLIFNASTRQTAIWYLNNNVYAGSAFGPSIPFPWTLVGIADFNRDGKSDYLLFNPTTRASVIWYLSGTTRIASAFGPTIAAGYNLSGAADFNRDGKPDYLLFNPSTRQTAIWYLNNNVRTGMAAGPTLAAGYILAAP